MRVWMEKSLPFFPCNAFSRNFLSASTGIIEDASCFRNDSLSHPTGQQKRRQPIPVKTRKQLQEKFSCKEKEYK